MRAIRIEFTSRLYFSLAKDRDYTAGLIAEQISDTNSGLTRLIKAQAAIPDNQVFNRLGLDLRIRQIKSILEWLESCYELVTPSTMKTKQA